MVSPAHVEVFCVDKVLSNFMISQILRLKMITGRQHLGALFNLVAYYVLALPLGITLAFHPKTHLGLQGLWLGMSLF